MKTPLLILLVVVAALPLLLRGQALPGGGDPARKKIAVVLSGGGAKGAAHIGALKVLERAGIPIDMIVGTSMGAIVGGLYSIGYTPDQIDSMIMAQNWGLLLSDRTRRRDQPYAQRENSEKYQVSYPFGKKIEGVTGLIKGTNLEMLFNDLMVGHHDTLSFGSLPIPFACVATNIVDGAPVVFHSGVLPTAMRASMAIPGVFTPLYTDDGMVLVDGGLTNNFPTDVALEMGADVIIGIDVQARLKEREGLTGAGSVLGQIIEIAMQQQTYHQNVTLADLYVRVDVDGFSAANFNLPDLDSLIDRGERDVALRMDDLLRLKRETGLDEGFAPAPRTPYIPLNKRGDFHVYEVVFHGLGPREQKWLMRKCHIAENSRMNIDKLNHCMSMLDATVSHSNIYYSLRDTLDGYNLFFHMNAVKGNSFSGGVEFDTEEIASLLLNGTFRLGHKAPMEASVTGRFGKRMMAGIDYLFLATPLSWFKFNYSFRHTDVDIHSEGNRYYNATFNHHMASLSFIDMNFLRQNLRMELGISYQKYYYLSWLTNYRFVHEGDPLALNDEHFVNYYAKFDFETLDSRYFTRRGTAVSIGYEMFTDNFYRFKGHAPFSALSLSWLTAFPLTRNLSLVPAFYGRMLMGTDIPFSALNMAGGKFFGRYLPQQMPFDGIRYMEAVPNTFLAARVQLRQRILRRHYVSASFNYALAEQSFLSLLSQGRNYFGAAIDYGYDLRSFPLMISLSWSNVIRTLGFYVQAGYTF